MPHEKIHQDMDDLESLNEFLKELVISVVVAACFSAFLAINFEYNADHWISNVYNINVESFNLFDECYQKFILGVCEPLYDVFVFILLFYSYWSFVLPKRSLFWNIISLTFLSFWPKVTFHIVMIFFDPGVRWYHTLWAITYGVVLILIFRYPIARRFKRPRLKLDLSHKIGEIKILICKSMKDRNRKELKKEKEKEG